MYCRSLFVSLWAAGLKRCQKERLAALAWSGSAPAGVFVPQCTNDGEYKLAQCAPSGDYCWCVDQNGKPIPRTRSSDKISCADTGLSLLTLLITEFSSVFVFFNTRGISHEHRVYKKLLGVLDIPLCKMKGNLQPGSALFFTLIRFFQAIWLSVNVRDSMQLVDLANFSLNVPKMESTSLYSVRTAFAGVLISMEMNFMAPRLMGVHKRGARINQHQVFISPC